MTRTPFSRRAVAWLVALGALSFGTFVALLAFGDVWVPPPSAAADAYSRSALGHAAFVAWARRTGHPVLVSRWRSSVTAGPDTLLVVAEPDLGEADREGAAILGPAGARAGPMLLVLPKRVGTVSETRAGWVADARLRPSSEPDALLERIHAGTQVLRPLTSSGAWDEGSVPVAPTLVAPQLLAPAEGLEPVVAAPEGILVGRLHRGATAIWILSDPDVLANHGLAKGDNAALLARVLDLACPPGGTIVVDETLHGHVLRPSLSRALFGWPLVLALVQAALAAAALLGAAVGRHGAPLPAGDAVPAGKRILLENTADLLHAGGHHAHAVELYLAGATQRVLKETHAPAGLTRAEAEDWIGRAERARGAQTTLADLRASAALVRGPDGGEARRAVVAARRIHAWRAAMGERS